MIVDWLVRPHLNVAANNLNRITEDDVLAITVDSFDDQGPRASMEDKMVIQKHANELLGLVTLAVVWVGGWVEG